MMARDDFDPLAPQREAAFFYGLFLRGTMSIRCGRISTCPGHAGQVVLARDFEISFRENLRRVYAYRKQVLAISMASFPTNR